MESAARPIKRRFSSAAGIATCNFRVLAFSFGFGIEFCRTEELNT